MTIFTGRGRLAPFFSTIGEMETNGEKMSPRKALILVDLIGASNESDVEEVLPALGGGCCGDGTANACAMTCGGESISDNASSGSSSNNEVIDMLVDACIPQAAAETTMFSVVVKEVKARMTGAEVNISTVTVLLKYAMEVIELTQVTGTEQKELAVKVVRKVIVDAPLSDDAERACMAVIDSGVLNDVVDLVIDATKGRLDINQLKKKGKKCLLGCMRR